MLQVQFLLQKFVDLAKFRWCVKTYTVISFHNLYHQPPQLIPISIHNLYHFEGSASTSTTYTINWHQSGITYTIPEISIAELIPSNILINASTTLNHNITKPQGRILLGSRAELG